LRRSRVSPARSFALVACALLAMLFVFQTPLMTAPAASMRGLMAPPEQLATSLWGGLGQGLSVFGDISSLRARNRSLAAQNQALQAQIAGLQAQGAENHNLRSALNFERSFGGAMVAAQVIAESAAGLDSSLTIDRGSSSGVAPGMVVVTGGGLVGIVSAAAVASAQVQTLADPRLRVNAYTATSQLNGTVSGGPGALLMSVIPSPGVVARAGEAVLTSGVGGEFPRGIMVGRVVSFASRPAAILESARLAWANHVTQISVVLVLTSSPGR